MKHGEASAWVLIGTFLGLFLGTTVAIWTDKTRRMPYPMKAIPFMLLGMALGCGAGFVIAILRSLSVGPPS